MSDELQALKEELKQLNYFISQMVVELKRLNDNLENMNLLMANREVIREEQKEEKRPEGFKGDIAALQRYIKVKCPTVWKHLDDIRALKNGDFLILFEYVKGATYEQMAEEIKQTLHGSYSRKYKGFIIPGAREGEE